MEINQAGCELQITESAANEFKQMCIDEDKHWVDSYLRIGANPGGCSGWKFTLDYDDESSSGHTKPLQEGNRRSSSWISRLADVVLHRG